MDQYDDQSILERLTAWWAGWGRILVCLLMVAFISIAGVSGWKYWQQRQTERAALLYEQLQHAISSEFASSSETKKHIVGVATTLEKQFGRTPYAQMGALVAAKALYQISDAPAAKAQLQWAMDSALDAEYRYIARLRLATALLEEKAYDAALRLLEPKPSVPAFAALYAERRGDVLAVQGRRAQARTAYRDALQSIEAKSAATRHLVQVKLDALGG